MLIRVICGETYSFLFKKGERTSFSPFPDVYKRQGEIVLKGITQMKIGLGFEGGIAVVILAIILDRITQGMVRRKDKK